MNREHVRQLVYEALMSVAPEVQTDAIASARPLREQVDLDSMDWLNFLIALHERTGVTVPEADYSRVRTVDDLLEYIAAQPQPKM